MKRLLLLLVFVPVLASAGRHLQDTDIDASCNGTGEGKLPYWDNSAKKLKCISLSDCGPNQVLTKHDGVVACQAVVTDPITPVTEQLLAFRGCEGSGCLTAGGRGGTIYTVNSLADTTGACTVNANGTTSGTCTLRDCLLGTSKRVCVFSVGGSITLDTAINVISPYLTVAGQTAPGGGILIKGARLIAIRTHDVVWRYTRLRRGFTAGVQGDTLAILANAYNVVVDHNSLSWSQDETLDISGYTANGTQPRQVTASWNVISEPLGYGHQCAALLEGQTTAVSDLMTDIDYHHNLFAHLGWRAPIAWNKSTRWINNVVYNYSKWASRVGGGMQADFIGNLYKRGPLGTVAGYTHEIDAWSPTGPSGTGQEASGTMSLYIVGNKGPNNATPANDNWATMTSLSADSNAAESGAPLATDYKRTSRMADVGVPITVQDVATVESTIGNTVGAYQRLGCDGAWVAARDSVDVRVIADFVNGTGMTTLPNEPVANQNVDPIPSLGGWPTISTGTACTDTDKDGMPDAWETAQGLNPNDPSDAWLIADGQVYPNLSRFLNGQ